LVKPIALQRRHINIIQAKFLNLEGPKAHSYIKCKVDQHECVQIRVLKGMLN